MDTTTKVKECIYINYQNYIHVKSSSDWSL